MKKLASLLLLAVAAPAFALPSPTDAPYAWGSQLTVAGYAGEDALSDFPVLVRIAANVPTGFSYSQLQRQDNADLCFIDMAGNGLPFEIDTWDPNGESLVWVTLPTMTNGAQFVMCWGSATSGKTICADNPFAGYKGVWHMKSVDPADSSPNGYNGTHRTGNLSVVAGPVGAALNVPRTSTSDGITCGNVIANSELTGGFTIEGWCRPTQYGGMSDGAAMFGKKQLVSLRINSATRVTLTTPGKSDHHMDFASGVLPAVNTWWHFAATFKMNTSGGLNFYINGQPAKTANAGDISDKTGTTEMFLGNNEWNQAFKGDLDEIRLSAGLRSADWIAATYATQSDPAFIAAGLATPYDATSEPIVSVSAPSSALGYTNATLGVTVASLGMDAGRTADADWADLLLVVSANEDLSSPVHTISLGRVSSAPASLSASVVPLDLTTTYYAQAFATNSFGVSGESGVVSFTTPVPGPEFTARINTDHIAPDISLLFTSPGLGGAVTRIIVDVSTSDDFSDPALSRTYTVNLAAMPTNVNDIVLTGLPSATPLHYRFTAANASGYAKAVDVEAANPVGDGNNVWSGLSEDIDDPDAYVFAGGLPAPGKTLYFTKPAGLSPVIDKDTVMPSLRFTNGQTDDADTQYLNGYHSCGYDLAGTGVLTFNAEKPIISGTKGTNVVRNPICFNRSNSQTVYVHGGNSHLVLSGELKLPGGVSNTTMRATSTWGNNGGTVHFAGPSPDFMGKLHIESNCTLSLDHPGAMTNVSQVFFGEGWGSYTYLKNNTGAPMTFPRCETMNNETGWSSTRVSYLGAPFVFPVGKLVWGPRAWDGVISADLVVRNIRVTKNGSNGDAGLEKNGTGLLAVMDTTEWSSHDCKHYIRLRGGCLWAQTAAGLPPGGDFLVPDGSDHQSTLGIGDDFSPMLDGSSTPRVFQSSASARWGFTGFGGDRTVCWNGDPTLNLTNTTSGSVAVKLLSDGTTTNTVGKTYDNYYAYPARFVFGNRSEFADGTVVLPNPIRYELGQDWDTATYFESTNHVVAARLRGSLRLGNRDRTWSFSGRGFGGYLALEADNADFTGKIAVTEKGNLLLNSNLVARAVTVQSGSGIGGIGTLATDDGTTVQSGGTLFGGEWNKGGVFTLGGKVTLASGSALRAEVGASNDRIGMARLAAGSTLKLTAPVYVDVDTDPRVSPVRGAAVKILDWSEASFDSGAMPAREDFVARPERNSDLRTLYLFTRPDGLYVNYISVRYPPSTLMILR